MSSDGVVEILANECTRGPVRGPVAVSVREYGLSGPAGFQRGAMEPNGVHGRLSRRNWTLRLAGAIGLFVGVLVVVGSGIWTSLGGPSPVVGTVVGAALILAGAGFLVAFNRSC